ncbi:MAG: hypothetical protein ACI8RD_004130 [Bacillariaceae sp.]
MSIPKEIDIVPQVGKRAVMKNLTIMRIYSCGLHRGFSIRIRQLETVPNVSSYSISNRRFFASTGTSAATSTTSNTAVNNRRPRRKRGNYEQFGEAKLATSMMATTTSLKDPFQYSGDSIDDYKKKAELSPWVPVPDSVARKIFDRAIPEHIDGTEINKKDEVSVFFLIFSLCFFFFNFYHRSFEKEKKKTIE